MADVLSAGFHPEIIVSHHGSRIDYKAPVHTKVAIFGCCISARTALQAGIGLFISFNDSPLAVQFDLESVLFGRIYAAT